MICPFCKIELGRPLDQHSLVKDGKVYCEVNMITFNKKKLGTVTSE